METIIKETPKLKKDKRNIFQEHKTEIVATSAGDTCHPGQNGHEIRDPNGNIMTCRQESDGVYRWRLGR